MIRLLFLAAIALTVFWFNGCGCEQTGYKEIPSPDGRYMVMERETNCGATDPFGTAISIRTRNPRLGISWLGPTKRVFLADVGLDSTSVEWLDNGRLKIVCSHCEKYGISEQVEEWRDVKINFDVGKAGKGIF
jgi:hypothetical protein